LLKARMDVPDDQLEQLDQLSHNMNEQFKNISGVKVTS